MIDLQCKGKQMPIKLDLLYYHSTGRCWILKNSRKYSFSLVTCKKLHKVPSVSSRNNVTESKLYSCIDRWNITNTICSLYHCICAYLRHGSNYVMNWAMKMLLLLCGDIEKNPGPITLGKV